MANYATIATKATGSTVDATYLASIKDALEALAKPPRGQAHNAAAQSVANITGTAVTLNSTLFLSGLTLSSNKLVIPSGAAGIYDIYAHVEFATNATGERQLVIQKNGTNQVTASTMGVSNIPTGLSLVHSQSLAVADQIGLSVYQASGGSLNISAGSAFLTVIMRSWA